MILVLICVFSVPSLASWLVETSEVYLLAGARRGIATSTGLDDQLDASASPAAGADWPSSSLRHSMTSAPHEDLVQTTLQRSDRDDGFGFSVSNGVYDSGVYVGAVKQQGPAADKLQPYDRILKVSRSLRQPSEAS